MRIAIEAQRLQRRKKHGMDIVALELLKAINRNPGKHEYFVFLKQDEDPLDPKEFEHLHLVELPSAPYPIWEQWILPRAAKRFKVDILHCTSNTAPVYCPVNLVVTIHDIIYLERLIFNKGTWYQRLGNVYRRWNVPIVYKKAQKVITVSHFEEENMRRHFKEKTDKLVVVYNAAGPHFSEPISISDARRIKEQFRLPDRFIFFLGNTEPKKNTENLLKAYKIYASTSEDPIPLVMPDLPEVYFKSLIAKLHLTPILNQILLTGYIPNKDLPGIYKQASLFVYPSIRESFGIPLVEAMSCGVPVLAANSSCLPEIADKAALFADPLNPSDIAAKMELILSSPELKAELKIKGEERARFFSWIKSAEQLKLIYESLNKL